MKKILALFCTLLLLCGLSACNPAEKPQEMPAEMAEMAAPIDALTRCMLENNLTYAPDNPEFFWTALFYFTGGYGLGHPLAAEHDTTYQLILPAAAMEDYAAALFASQDELPEMPADMEGNIFYAEAEDAYFISRGDIGLSECRLTNYAEADDGYTLTAELWSTGDSIAKIAAWDVFLVEAEEGALYPYRVAGMTLQEESDATEIPEMVENAIFNGLADSHTAELTLPDGSVEAFQFDADSAVAEALSSLKEGDGITIHYTHPANSAPMLLAVE